MKTTGLCALRSALLFATAVWATSLTTACTCNEHELSLHAKGFTELHANLSNAINVDQMWQTDWRSKWRVDWDEAKYGPLGYTAPDAFRLCYFHQATRSLLGDLLFAGNHARLNLDYGAYDFLIYNHDYQGNVVTETQDWSSLSVTSHPDPYLALPDSIALSGQPHEMPEQMFSVFAQGARVSDNIDEYEYLPGENLYLHRMDEQLQPLTHIYLVQVELENNQGRVSNCGGFVVDGMASQADIITRQPSATPAAYFFGALFQDSAPLASRPYNRSKAAESRAPERKTLIGGRLLTFGQTEQRNMLYICLAYSNGSRRWVMLDITDRMAELPRGGVIDITLSVDDHPPLTPVAPSTGTGGFDVNVGGWDNTDDYNINI